MATRFLEPSPRWNHYLAAVRGQLYVWGGRTRDFSKENRELSVSVHSFNQCMETWQTRATTGKHPPGLYGGACTSSGHHLYLYGGGDGSQYYDSLYQLDTDSLEWSQLPSGPMRKCGCGMISHEDKLILFGGHGFPSDPTQPGVQFGGGEWTNELHVFDIKKREWSYPIMTGTRPTPRSFFTFTKVDCSRAVVFGGQCGPPRGRCCHVFILDLESMHWKELRKNEEPWPAERSAHAAVCLWNGGDYPQLLITGGMDGNGKVLSDAWILDLHTERWREVDVPDLQERCTHHATAFSLCPGVMEVTLFGGCREWESNFTTDAGPSQIANTTVLRFEHTSSAGPSSGEWVLTDMAESRQLGTRQRIEEKVARMVQSIPTSPATPKPVAEGETTWREAKEERDRRVRAAEDRAREAEGRAAEGERRWREGMKERDRRVQAAEDRAREAEGRAAEGERRLSVSEKSMRECEEKLQRLETQWVVDRREIQLTGPELGRGGWATVSVATFRGVRVAAKCIHNQIISPHNIQLFQREMDMAARIRHPNMLQFIGATTKGEMVILTELMPTSLRAELEGGGFFSLRQVTSTGVDVARALNYLHLMQPHPLVHRDISSANALLQPLPNSCWRAKVSDYGTVNIFKEVHTANPGNSAYSAPEANDPTKQSPKMDIFSFGVLLVEMLTGEFPDSTNRARQLYKIFHQPLLALVQRCLSQDRDNRPSASDIITELDS